MKLPVILLLLSAINLSVARYIADAQINANTICIANRVQYLERKMNDPTFHERPLFRSLIEYCFNPPMMTVTKDTPVDAVVRRWLEAGGANRTRDLLDPGLNVWHEFRGINDSRIPLPAFWRNQICASGLCVDRIAKFIAALMTANHLSDRSRTLLPKPANDIEIFHRTGIYCLENVCAFNYITDVLLEQNTLSRWTVFSSSAPGALARQLRKDMRQYELISQTFSDACWEWTIASKANNSAADLPLVVDVRRAELACETEQLSVMRSRYRIAYSKLGLVAIANIILSVANPGDETSTAYFVLPGRNLNTTNSTLNTETNRMLNTETNRIKRQSVAEAVLKRFGNQILAAHAFAIAANILLVIAIQRSELAQVKLWPPVRIFLQNLCSASLLFAASELSSAALILTVKQSPIKPGQLRHVTADGSVVICNQVQCQVEALFQFPSLDDSYYSRHAFLYASAALLVLRTVSYCAMLANLVVLGMFQAIPLFRPFSRKPLLNHPKRAVLATWGFAILTATISNVPLVVEYFGQLREHDNQTDGQTFRMLESTILMHRLKTIQSTVIELGTTVTLVILAAMAQLVMSGSLCYIWRAGSQHVAAKQSICTGQSLRALATSAIAMDLWLVAACTEVALLGLVHMKSENIGDLTNIDIYGYKTLETYLTFFYVSRLVTAILLPLATPILILLRYQALSKAILKPIVHVFKQHRPRRESSVAITTFSGAGTKQETLLDAADKNVILICRQATPSL